MKTLYAIALVFFCFVGAAEADAIVYANGTGVPSWEYQAPDPALFPQAIARPLAESSVISVPVPEGGSFADWLQNILFAFALWWFRRRNDE